MSYIAPNSNIYLYNNILLDNSYKDTLYFETISEQNNYFESTKPYKYLFTNQYYQRTNKGTLKIEKNAELIGDCNYLRFNNTREGESKWYYAFITDWEYINENVTEITYEIDDIQTYMFDVRIEDSFVVRCHSSSDGYNENVITEDINIGGDYICVDDHAITGFQTDTLVLMSTKIGSAGQTPSSAEQIDPVASIVGFPRASSVNRLPTTVGMVKFQELPNNPAVNQATSWLENRQWVGVPESVIGCYYVPSVLASCVPLGASYPLESGNTASLVGSTYVGSDVNLLTYPTYFKAPNEEITDAYYPRNKKLYNYPYNYFTVTNLQGQEVEFKYELFYGNAVFGLTGIFLPQPTIMLYPKNYRGVEDDYDSAITLTDFPTMPITVDGYQQWLNHNAGKMTADALNLVMTAIAGSMSAGLTPVLGTYSTLMTPYGPHVPAENTIARPLRNARSDEHFTPNNVSFVYGESRRKQQRISNLSNVATGVAGAIGSFSDASRRPNGATGNSSGGGVMFALDKYQFRQHRMQIRRENAEMLDTFFDIYGYQQNKVMHINQGVRPIYTYIKTAGCNVNPLTIGSANRGCNANVLSHISEIYDNGITFWKASANPIVGDYSIETRRANIVP